MLKQPVKIYWDASVFHALFAREPGRVEQCERIEGAARNGLVVIYTSAITWVEVVRLKQTLRNDPANETIIKKYFAHKYIKPITCDRIVGDVARSLLWAHSHLEYKDAIHVASAVHAGIPTVLTYDSDFKPLNGTVGNPPLRICEPGGENDFILSN